MRIDPAKLKEQMERSGYSTAELAKRAAVARYTLHQILRGEYGFQKDETVEKIAKALGRAVKAIVEERK